MSPFETLVEDLRNSCRYSGLPAHKVVAALALIIGIYANDAAGEEK